MSSSRRILLAVADPLLRQTLAEHLGAAGHAVTPVEHADTDQARGQDLAIIDDALAGGAEFCRALAGAIRVMVLGAPLPGADTAVAKPLRLSALLAAVIALPPVPTEAPGIALGHWWFDAASRVLVDGGGARVRLTDKEAAILSYLAADGGVVPRERLLAEVWGYSAAVTTHTLETHIYRLRRKLERDPANAETLRTEPGGYRLYV